MSKGIKVSEGLLGWEIFKRLFIFPNGLVTVLLLVALFVIIGLIANGDPNRFASNSASGLIGILILYYVLRLIYLWFKFALNWLGRLASGNKEEVAGAVTLGALAVLMLWLFGRRKD